jgi:hypothetical protein
MTFYPSGCCIDFHEDKSWDILMFDQSQVPCICDRYHKIILS